MFIPAFTITPAMLSNVEQAARILGFLQGVRLPDAWRLELAAEVTAAQKDGSLSGFVPGTDAAALLASTVQGVAIRWALGVRDFDLMVEGMRLVDVQLGLLAA